MVVRGSAEGRARSAETKIVRSKLAFRDALERLLGNALASTGTGLLITPGQVAREAGLSVSTLYNRFPGGVGAIAFDLVEELHRRGSTPHADLLALSRLHSAKLLGAGSESERLMAKVQLLSYADKPTLRTHENAMLLIEEAEMLGDRRVLAAAYTLAARSFLWSYSTPGRQKLFELWEKAFELHAEVGSGTSEQLRALEGMRSANAFRWDGLIPDEGWSVQREVLRSLSELNQRLSRFDSAEFELALLDKKLPISKILIEHSARIREAILVPDSGDLDLFIEAAAWAAQLGHVSVEEIKSIQNVLMDFLNCKGAPDWTQRMWRLELCRVIQEGIVDSIDTLFADPGFPLEVFSDHLMWAHISLIHRRKLNMSSTREAEKEFIKNAQLSLGLTEKEARSLAGQLSVDMDASPAEILAEEDPAYGAVEELKSVVKELMVVQPQSKALRQIAYDWAGLAQVEFL